MKFSAIEIYNEAVRDLLSTDNTPLRLLDDPDVRYQFLVFHSCIYYFTITFMFCLICKRISLKYCDHQRGTVVEKLTEETLRDWSHLKELLSICEGKAFHKSSFSFSCCILNVVYVLQLKDR